MSNLHGQACILIILAASASGFQRATAEGCMASDVYDSLDFDNLSITVSNPWNLDPKVELDFWEKNGVWRETTYGLRFENHEVVFQEVCGGNGVPVCWTLQISDTTDTIEVQISAIESNDSGVSFIEFDGSLFGGNSEEQFLVLAPFSTLFWMYRGGPSAAVESPNAPDYSGGAIFRRSC